MSLRILFVIAAMIYSVNANCFTMPPKHNQISEWTVSLPRVNSPDYEHDTYECPPTYCVFKQYSNIEKYCSGNLFANNCYPRNMVVSYVVCCKCDSEFMGC